MTFLNIYNTVISVLRTAREVALIMNYEVVTWNRNSSIYFEFDTINIH